VPAQRVDAEPRCNAQHASAGRTHSTTAADGKAIDAQRRGAHRAEPRRAEAS
jgi:hypothetical protein